MESIIDLNGYPIDDITWEKQQPKEMVQYVTNMVHNIRVKPSYVFSMYTVVTYEPKFR